jgi:hypothetical protein
MNQERTGKCLRQMEHIISPKFLRDKILSLSFCFVLFSFLRNNLIKMTSLRYLFFDIRILITPLVSSNSYFSPMCCVVDKIVVCHTHKTKDRVARTPLKTGGELRCSGRVSSSCSTSDTHRVNLVTNPVISHESGKDREVFTDYPFGIFKLVFQSHVLCC